MIFTANNDRNSSGRIHNNSSLYLFYSNFIAFSYYKARILYPCENRLLFDNFKYIGRVTLLAQIENKVEQA